MAPVKPEKRAISPAKTCPPQTRSATPISPSNKVPSPPSSTTTLDDRTLALNKELTRVRKRAEARGKEVDSLRQRVQELEPEVRRLAKELEKRLLRETSRSPLRGRKQPAPTSMALSDDGTALRARLAAADSQAKILQLRCTQLELERSFGKITADDPDYDDEQNEAEKEEDGTSNPQESRDVDDERHRARDKGNEAERIKRQLEVAERRVKNSLYINEAHESLATKATEREKAANVRAAELGRRLDRALEKLESIERKDIICNLETSCTRDEEGIYLAERELRAHQMDPGLHLPINTAKRRQFARSEQRLHRLRLRHESQAAALCQAQATERLHSDLRRAAGLGDIPGTMTCLDSGISVNVPDQSGLSAFLYACGQATAELIQILVEAGGDVLDGDGTMTGLIIAARKGSLEVVQTLLEAGADVGARDSAGGTALHAAILRRHVDVARVLLENGADCNAIDQGNNTPLHMLASASIGEDGGGGIGRGEIGAELVSLLLEWGASADIKNSNGLTPMSAALETRNRALVLAYRVFFGEDSGLAAADMGLDVDSTNNDFVSAKAHGKLPINAPKKATTTAYPTRGRSTASA